jgi:O-antigen/teichoic acid export membrane protein
MNIQRIAKQFAASATSQVIIFGQTLVLPPIFIHRYGVALYGEWLTLSAAAAYLTTLQFGMQTYVNNELTMRYGRGEMDEYQLMQSTALRMLLGIALAGALLLGIVFLLPVNHWLHISMSQMQVSVILYFLGLQMLASLPMNYFAGTFMVFGMAHRGTAWQNISRVMTVSAAVIMAWIHTSFAAIAVGQFAAVLVYALLMLIDLKRLEPTVFPTLRYWDRAVSKAILGPSGYFFLIYSCNFLVYQLPVLLIQRILGPVAVVAFNIMRSIFSMMRQGLSIFTNSIGPEVTNLFGRREWRSLSDLYSLSEKVLFAAIPPLNITALLLAPVLLRVWLHKPYLYSLATYALMAMVSAAISVKDHKIQFQISTNHHRELARVAFGSNLAMVVLAFFALHRFGLPGFLVLWFLTEAGQAAFILWLNARLLTEAGPVDQAPVVRMAFLLPGSLVAACFIERHIHDMAWLAQGVIAAVFGLLLLGLSAWTFDLRHVLRRYLDRRARMAALAN